MYSFFNFCYYKVYVRSRPVYAKEREKIDLRIAKKTHFSNRVIFFCRKKMLSEYPSKAWPFCIGPKLMLYWSYIEVLKNINFHFPFPQNHYIYFQRMNHKFCQVRCFKKSHFIKFGFKTIFGDDYLMLYNCWIGRPNRHWLHMCIRVRRQKENNVKLQVFYYIVIIIGKRN